MPPTKSQDSIVQRFKKLEISMKLRNPPMDDPDLRWVKMNIEELDDGVFPDGNELKYANVLWKKYR